MDRFRDYHTKLRKSEKDKYCMSITYMWNQKKNDINELIYKTVIRVTDVENKFMVTSKEKGRLGLTHTTIYKIDN